MLLCLDVGNSQIVGGIFESLQAVGAPFVGALKGNDQIQGLHPKSKKQLQSLSPQSERTQIVYSQSATAANQISALDHNPILCFRHETSPTITSDQFGAFLKSVLRENEIDHRAIKNIAIGSVVPSLDYSLHAACKKYFGITPFMLKIGIKTGIKIKTQNPNELGSDLLAGAIAATQQFPARDIIIIDLGTATTLMAVTAAKEFLGGAIVAGLRLSVNALSRNTAKLFPIEIIQAKLAIGRSTITAMQSGIYFAHLGAIKEIIAQITKESFHSSKPIIIGTGGFAHLFAESKVFDIIVPNLVLHGLRLAFEMNQ